MLNKEKKKNQIVNISGPAGCTVFIIAQLSRCGVKVTTDIM